MKSIRKTPKCDSCGRRYPLGLGLKGLPTMLGFVQKDGRTINVCQNCIMKVGTMNQEEKDEFFEKLGVTTIRDDNLLE